METSESSNQKQLSDTCTSLDRSEFPRLRHIRPRPFPLVNLRRGNGRNAERKKRSRRGVSLWRPAIYTVLTLDIARRRESYFRGRCGFAERRKNRQKI